jgi:hypothetical protein
MVMMGTRTGPRSANTHITYETKKDVKGIRPKRPRGADVDYEKIKAASVRD